MTAQSHPSVEVQIPCIALPGMPGLGGCMKCMSLHIHSWFDFKTTMELLSQSMNPCQDKTYMHGVKLPPGISVCVDQITTRPWGLPSTSEWQPLLIFTPCLSNCLARGGIAELKSRAENEQIAEFCCECCRIGPIMRYYISSHQRYPNNYPQLPQLQVQVFPPVVIPLIPQPDCDVSSRILFGTNRVDVGNLDIDIHECNYYKYFCVNFQYCDKKISRRCIKFVAMQSTTMLFSGIKDVIALRSLMK